MELLKRKPVGKEEYLPGRRKNGRDKALNYALF
jgi:hypothetical protein